MWRMSWLIPHTARREGTFEREVGEEGDVVCFATLFGETGKDEEATPAGVVFIFTPPDAVPAKGDDIHISVCHATPTNDLERKEPVCDNEDVGDEDTDSEDDLRDFEGYYRLDLGGPAVEHEEGYGCVSGRC